MKSLIAAILMLSGLAHAAETKIFETINYRYESHTVGFEVNEKLGRAWVALSLEDNQGEFTDRDDHRIKIEGLSYDTGSQTVVLEQDGQLIECGKLVKRGWIFGKSVKPTGRCTFKAKNVKLPFDDGFEIRMKPVFQLFMNVE